MTIVPRLLTSRDGEDVSSELPPLLLAIYDELRRRAPDLRPLADSIERLLVFLASTSGRTNANCWATDLFFCLQDGWDGVDWEHVPQPFSDLLGDLGGALHDTVSAPEVAANFSSTPEQLLSQLKRARKAVGAA